MYVDMPESQLPDYRSSQIDPADFDEFWDATLTTARAAASAVHLEPVDSGLTTVDIFDVTFSGWDGQPVKAWLRLPKGVTGPLPAIVQFVGYGGERSMSLWQFNGHEGGGIVDEQRALEFFRSVGGNGLVGASHSATTTA